MVVNGGQATLLARPLVVNIAGRQACMGRQGRLPNTKCKIPVPFANSQIPKTGAVQTIPEAWKKRGLMANPKGNSWFLPLRLNLYEKPKEKN